MVADAEKQGYRVASPEDTESYANEQKYGSTGQQVLTGVEALGRGLVGPVAPAIEEAMGANPENIRGRQKTNEGINTLGEVAGLALPAVASLGASAAAKAGVGGAGMLARGLEAAAPFTQSGLLEKVGAQGAAHLGLEGEGVISKVGSMAVKNAIETTLLAASDEASKAVTQDPNQSIGSVATNIGLSGLLGAGIGGGVGVISPLWKATVGDKMGELLEKIQKRANGEPLALDPEVQKAIDVTGLELNPEIRAGLSQDPELNKQFNVLRESKTKPGLDLKESLKDFRGKVDDSVLNAVGRTKEDLGELSNFSNYEAGDKLKTHIADQIEKTFEPISQKYDEITAKFDKVPLKAESDLIADKIAQLAEKEKWTLSPSSDQFRMYNEVMNELPNVKTVEDLRKYQSLLKSKGATDYATKWPVAKQISNIFDDVLQNTYLAEAGKAGEKTLMDYTLAKQAYKTGKDLIEELNDRLHVGKYGGPGTFVNALKDMKPEEILTRLSKTNDVGLQGILQKEFPEAAQMVKKFNLDRELKKALVHTPEGYSLRTETLFKNLDKATPELRNFMMPPGSQEKLGAIRTMIKALPEFKTSGTAGHLDSLLSKVPGSAAAVASLLMGHNPAVGFMIGQSAKWLARDAPDAIRMGLLKFLGSAGKVEPEAFKTMVEYFNHAIKGELLVNKAVKAVYKAGAEVLPQTLVPSEKERRKLDKKLMALSEDQSSMADIGGKMSHYLPNHGVALGQNAMQAVNYLNSIRPKESQPNPLDAKIKPTEQQKSNFENALNIAEQPLLVLDKIKEGTVTPTDLIHLKNLYPSMIPKITQKLMDGMSAHLDKDGIIPYKTKLGLSLFMGQPLDSTMTPGAIMAAQPQPQQPPEGGQQMAQHKGPHSMKNISKLAQGAGTSGQVREMQKAGMMKA